MIYYDYDYSLLDICDYVCWGQKNVSQQFLHDTTLFWVSLS